MPPRRIVALVSIAGHALVVAFVIVAQLLAVGPLPIPRHPLQFDEVRFVQLRDIELPAPPRHASTSAAGAVSPSAAPIVAPSTISQETGLENARAPAAPLVDSVGADIGLAGGIDALPGERALPLPPPLPPSQPVRPHTGMQMPRKLVSVEPVYPAIARSARVEGVVILEAILDTAGGVESVRVLKSIPMLDQAAIDAVRQWRFTPTLLNGVAVPIVMTVTVQFSLR
jgi:periplasmic protein TonB